MLLNLDAPLYSVLISYQQYQQVCWNSQLQLLVWWLVFEFEIRIPNPFREVSIFDGVMLSKEVFHSDKQPSTQSLLSTWVCLCLCLGRWHQGYLADQNHDSYVDVSRTDNISICPRDNLGRVESLCPKRSNRSFRTLPEARTELAKY